MPPSNRAVPPPRCRSHPPAESDTILRIRPPARVAAMPRRTAVLAALILSVVAVLAPSRDGTADERDKLKVGLQPDGRIVVPTNQILQPAGKQVTFSGRPVDLLEI